MLTKPYYNITSETVGIELYLNSIEKKVYNNFPKMLSLFNIKVHQHYTNILSSKKNNNPDVSR